MVDRNRLLVSYIIALNIFLSYLEYTYLFFAPAIFRIHCSSYSKKKQSVNK